MKSINDLLERLPKSALPFVKPLISLDDLPVRLAHLSKVLNTKNQTEAAEMIAEFLLENHSDSVNVKKHINWYLSKSVPLWHFNIVNDEERNSFFEKMLNKYVKPDMHVLEIGTGTGILSMFASKAGAKKVTTIEKEKFIADAAKGIIEDNGFDNIEVVNKPLEKVKIGTDLEEKADLLVCEIVDNSLLGERVIPLTNYAKKYLLKENAILLPSEYSAMGALIGKNKFSEKFKLDNVSGFDLSRFRKLTPATTYCEKSVDNDIISGPQELFHIDFQNNIESEAGENIVTFTALNSGVAEGIVQWIKIQKEDIVLENSPDNPSETWGNVIHYFDDPIKINEGESIDIKVSYKNDTIFFNNKY